MVNLPTGPRDDGDLDDLAALNLGAADTGDGETDLGTILGDYVGAEIDHDEDARWLDAVPAAADGGDEPAMPTFTVTNPPGTVTVTAHMDGRVHHIDLSPRAATLSESDLADEIVAIANLATLDARSAQYTLMLDGMREQGHDNVTTRDFLNRDLDLPTPEQARAARSELFTNRYAGEND